MQTVTMNKLKIYLLIPFSVLICVTAMAQKTGFYWYDLNESSNRLQGKLEGEVYTITALANDMFFFQKDWQKASLTMIDGDVFENIKLRYLAYGDEIIAFNENVRTLFKIEKETVKQFILKPENTNVETKFVKLCLGEKANDCRYYEELYSGNTNLYSFHFIEEVKVTPYNDKYGIMRDSEFRLNEWFYLFNDKIGLTKIQKNRRSFLKKFPGNRLDIKKITRKNKISIIDKNSLIQAVKLFDDEGLLD
jgi:hypothetical protein